jgi:dTDP-4-amino-4,6-dideoxygalactose transaminase
MNKKIVAVLMLLGGMYSAHGMSKDELKQEIKFLENQRKKAVSEIAGLNTQVMDKYLFELNKQLAKLDPFSEEIEREILLLQDQIEKVGAELKYYEEQEKLNPHMSYRIVKKSLIEKRQQLKQQLEELSPSIR